MAFQQILKDKPEFRGIEGDPISVNLAPFKPTPKLADIISRSCGRFVPLLITGESSRTKLVASNFAFEINGVDYLDYFAQWNMRDGENFSDGVYSFNHEAKRRDLEYHNMDSKGNPIKPSKFYFKKRQILQIIEIADNIKRKGLKKSAVLEIADIHESHEDFLEDLMDFVNGKSHFVIPELNNKVLQFKQPFIIIMTAKEGWVPKRNYEGILYTHKMEFPDKDDFKDEIMPYYNDLQKESYYPHIEAIVEGKIDLLFLARDNCLLRPGFSDFPMSVPELKESINVKIEQIKKDPSMAEEIIEQIKTSYKQEEQLVEKMDLGKTSAAVKSFIEQDKMRKAVGVLKLIKNNLPSESRKQITLLISEYNEISKKERMQTESELILMPRRNKLKVEILEIVDEFAEVRYNYDGGWQSPYQNR